MKSQIWLFLLLTFNSLLFGSGFYAQTSTEIKSKISKATPKKKADLYLDLGLQLYYETGKADSIVKYSLKSFELSKKTKDIRTQINALKFCAGAYSLNKEYTKSIKQLEVALILSKKINHKIDIADIYNKYGYNYQLQNKPEKAITSYINAAKIFEEIKDYDELIIVYQNIGSIFSELNQLEETIYYTKKMIETLSFIKEIDSKVSTYSAIASQFKYISKSKPIYLDSILIYGQKGLPLAKKNNFQNEVSEIENSIAYYYFQKKNTNKSIEFYSKSLQNFSFINDAVKFESYIGLFKCYAEFSNWKQAGICLDSVKNLPMINDYLVLKVDYLNVKFLFEKNTNQTSQALSTFELLKNLEDSLLSIEKGSRINELEQKYNRVKNESTIRDLSRDKKINEQKSSIQTLKINQLIIGVLLLILIIGVIIYLYYQNNQKRKRKIIEVEQRLNRARMDPHFVFNVLAAVQSLQLDSNRKEEAPLFISRISKVMRLTLESTYTELTSLEDELDFLKEYLELQRLLKNNSFSYSISITDEIDTFETLIPGMILQPFLENAIEHGLTTLEKDGMINMNIETKNKELHIFISDNGKGKVSKSKTHISRATSIINDRLSLLKDTYKKNARFETSINEFGGYEVQIVLPLLHEK